MTGPVSKLQKFSPTWHILRIFAGISLVYYAWMMFDLVTHPFSAGANGTFNPYLFRWLSALCGTVTVVVAVFILRRLPENRNGFLLLLWGVGAAGWSQRIDFGSIQVTGLMLVVFTLFFFAISLPALTALLFHFPSGQIYPTRLSGWAWGLVVLQGLAGILSNLGVPSYQNGLVINPAYIPVMMPFAALLNWYAVVIPPLAGVISLALRFRAGGVRERLQIKWLVWLAAIAIVLSILVPVAFQGDPSDQANNPAFALANIFVFLYWQLFPAAAIGIALLRYRLWDIDRIIRRTLVYGALTATLGLIYFGSVILLQQVLGGLTGESSIAIVLSTLLIAALFDPIRRRVQGFIDRRFYRQKYDAARTIESFSATARNQVEFEHLTTQLVNVIEKTIQPESISLWLGKDR